MRIFLEEMMLDGEDGFKAKLVGKFHLFEAAIVNGFFGFASPRTWNADFVEESKFHFTVPSAYRSFSNPESEMKATRERCSRVVLSVARRICRAAGGVDPEARRRTSMATASRSS